MSHEEVADRTSRKFVVYLNGDAKWISTHGGPYAPMKAREVRESMEKHIANGNHRDWSIPEDAEKAETVTKDELRELKEISLRADGGAEPNAETPHEVTHNGAPDRFVMCSGGMDSVAMAHYVIEETWDSEYGPWNKRPVVVYLQTGIGLSSQRLYVELLCDHYNWQLWTLRTQESFEDHTKEEGFYGESQHGKIFQRLKGRQQGKLATVSGNPHFYFGTRRAESQKRQHIKRDDYNDSLGAHTHNPICDWSDGRVLTYLQNHDVPFNPNWDASIPTDCACGATASREELIELEAEGYEAFAQKLRDLETDVEQEKRGTWAWSSFSENELRAKGALDDDRQADLSDLMCGPNCSGRSKALQPDGGSNE